MPDKIAVITGASSGIGQGIAVAFARAGFSVLIQGNQNLSGLEHTHTAVLEAHKQYSSNSSTIPSAKPVTADLSTAFNIEEFFSTACSWKKRIDVWVNAAGADVLTGCAKELSFSDKLHRLWQVDVQSTILLSRLAADYMRCRTTDIEEPKPTVINISWDQAERGMAGDSGQYFSAVKAAIAAFTRSLAMSIGPEVRANCLAPGWIQTSWGDQASSAWQQRAIGESSLHRWGNVGDIANAAVWLASKQAEFINGQVICINGGWRPSYQS